MVKLRPAILVVFSALLCLFCLAAARPSLAVEEAELPWTVNIYFENDLFTGTDRNYTNGVKISLISPDLVSFVESGKLPDWSLEYIYRLPFINDPDPALKRKVEFSLGQNMYTPADISRSDLIPDDRPYAGWTYFGAAFHTRSSERMDTIELQVGMVGPDSFAEETQKAVHDLRDLQRPNGWDNQLKNEPGLAAIYERKWQLEPVFSRGIFAIDAITHLGCSLGNVATYANTGFESRLGWNLPDDFGVSLIRPAGNTSFSTRQQQGGYLFVALNTRVVLRDIFLDGNTFADSHSIGKKIFVADLAGGAAIYFKQVKLTWTQVLRTKEFDGQPDNHSFGSLILSFFY
ncbi:MAG: lipid A deacylase LpxR family protein [Desulfocapsaceae bacterium]|nr:lipid A deacylase LpxR family protein [Desulfocapsaceae bacterium]